jgi:hypothetical protein
VLSNLKAKAGAKMNHGSTLINADSIRKAEVEQVFDTPADMYEHISNMIHEIDNEKLDNDLWEF